MDDWLVVRIRPQHYAKAEVNVSNQGADWYCPIAVVRSQKTGRHATVPLFPGYAFVRPAGEQWMFLRGTIGILDVLMAASETPAKLSADEVDRLRARESADGRVHLERLPGYAPGDKVHVSKCSVSLDAIVEGMSGEERVFVLLQVLGRWTRTEVDITDIVDEP